MEDAQRAGDRKDPQILRGSSAVFYKGCGTGVSASGPVVEVLEA
jgi:hypothetical protein